MYLTKLNTSVVSGNLPRHRSCASPTSLLVPLSTLSALSVHCRLSVCVVSVQYRLSVSPSNGHLAMHGPEQGWVVDVELVDAAGCGTHRRDGAVGWLVCVCGVSPGGETEIQIVISGAIRYNSTM